MNSAERGIFESWFLKQYSMPVAYLYQPNLNKYLEGSVQYAWFVWQAAITERALK